VQEIWKTTLAIRPRLHCPEIDEVDEIPLEHLISCDDELVQIGSRVKYRV
jgi:hypothetical protein